MNKEQEVVIAKKIILIDEFDENTHVEMTLSKGEFKVNKVITAKKTIPLTSITNL